MKKSIALVLLLSLLLSGCNIFSSEETIVGQWVYENGDRYYIIEADGTIFEVSTNGMGEYITSVWVTEDGGYQTFDKWYKVGEEYHWINPTLTNDEFPNGWDRVVHIDGDTMVIGDNVYEWYRLPKWKWLSKKDIYYFTDDGDDRPLSELV